MGFPSELLFIFSSRFHMRSSTEHDVGITIISFVCHILVLCRKGYIYRNSVIAWLHHASLLRAKQRCDGVKWGPNGRSTRITIVTNKTLEQRKSQYRQWPWVTSKIMSATDYSVSGYVWASGLEMVSCEDHSWLYVC